MFGKQDKMDVRCSSETEANRVSKNGHKEGKESKGSEGNISTSFLKDQQGTFSASAATEDCNKSKSSSADPDYCRRILVRGMTRRYFGEGGERKVSSAHTRRIYFSRGLGFALSLLLDTRGPEAPELSPLLPGAPRSPPSGAAPAELPPPPPEPRMPGAGRIFNQPSAFK